MLKNAALSGPFATQIIHEPIKDKYHELLPRWADALLGRGSRMHCHHQSPAYGRSSWRLCNDLGELRGPRLEVVRPRGIPDEGCLAISVGIGNSWEFEDALTALGCTVHAFDPTFELHKAHIKHVHNRPRVED